MVCWFGVMRGANVRVSGVRRPYISLPWSVVLLIALELRCATFPSSLCVGITIQTCLLTHMRGREPHKRCAPSPVGDSSWLTRGVTTILCGFCERDGAAVSEADPSSGHRARNGEALALNPISVHGLPEMAHCLRRRFEGTNLAIR